jgi:hypothetical protein
MNELKNNIMNKETLRNQFNKETTIAPVFANRSPYIDYIKWLENRLIQQINQNDLLAVVSSNEAFSEVAVCDCKAPAFRDEHGNHRCTECNELCNTD